MNKNQSLIKIDNQPYKIQFTKSEGILNLIMTNTVIQQKYETIMGSDAFLKMSTSAGYIRNMDQFLVFLNYGMNCEPKFNLTGKINQQDELLVLSLEVKLDLVNDN